MYCLHNHCSMVPLQTVCALQMNSSKWAILCTPPPCTSLCVWGNPNLPLFTPLLILSICCCCHRWNLRFLESDFRGQLPCHYSPHDNSTSVVPDHMNDLNREEPSRYVSVCNDSCLGPVVMLCVMSLFCWRVFPWMIMYNYLWMNSLGGHCLCMCVCVPLVDIYTPSVSTGQVSFLGGP